jgi:hypothetical protein
MLRDYNTHDTKRCHGHSQKRPPGSRAASPFLFIRKSEDGSTQTIEFNDLDPVLYEMFVPIGEHVSGLFTSDDLEIAARKLEPNSAAVLFLWENLWAANLRKAVGDSGGQLVERGQIAPEIIGQFEQALAAERQGP